MNSKSIQNRFENSKLILFLSKIEKLFKNVKIRKFEIDSKLKIDFEYIILPIY